MIGTAEYEKAASRHIHQCGILFNALVFLKRITKMNNGES
jgi:hypothetical protein